MRRGLVGLVVVTITYVMNAAWAGENHVGSVVVGNDGFEGIFGAVRNSTNDVELLICVDNGDSVGCVAKDSGGKTKGCVSTNVNHIAIVRGLTDSSKVIVKFDNAGNCTSIVGANSSSFVPKT